MIPNTPAIGIRFDIGKVDSGKYGLDCWKIFWRAVDPETIKGTLLFGGGTGATLSGREYVFCIAIQTTEESVLKAIKDALSASEEFKKVCASPMFIEGASAAAEPLPDAGRIDLNGNLVGEAYASRSALDIVWRERQPTAPATPQPPVTPERPRPASPRTSEKHVERAQRHIEPVPEQVLADFTKALELAPEKEQADILKQGGELYSKLGRKEEALADLSA